MDHGPMALPPLQPQLLPSKHCRFLLMIGNHDVTTRTQ